MKTFAALCLIAGFIGYIGYDNAHREIKQRQWLDSYCESNGHLGQKECEK
jgi:hypothetical protein